MGSNQEGWGPGELKPTALTFGILAQGRLILLLKKYW